MLWFNSSMARGHAHLEPSPENRVRKSASYIVPLLLCGSCVSATLMEAPEDECPLNDLLGQDLTVVVTNGRVEALSVILVARWDAARDGYALHPLCNTDRISDLGERGFVRMNQSTEGRIEFGFEAVAGGGDLVVPSRALPPGLTDEPITVTVAVTADGCDQGAICGTVIVETLFPSDIGVRLEGEVLIVAYDPDPLAIRWGCAQEPFSTPPSACLTCSAWECTEGRSFGAPCTGCLEAVCAAETTCCNAWHPGCEQMARRTCGCS